MKIPASKVPAQVWADHAETRSDLSDDEVYLLERWKTSKQVYRVSKELWNELSIDAGDQVPIDLLQRLPYDCMFLERKTAVEFEYACPPELAVFTRKKSVHISGMYYGYFCLIDSDTLIVGPLSDFAMKNIDTNSESLAALFGFAGIRLGQQIAFDKVPLPKGATFSHWLEETTNVLRRDLRETYEGILSGYELESMIGKAMFETESMLKTVVNCLLYICSKEPDVCTVYTPAKCRSLRSKQTDCTVHEMGFRIAKNLANVRRHYEAADSEPGSLGRHMPTHVRRAHWHGYWTGPKGNPTGLEIKWIPPIVVNADRGEVEGIVHDLRTVSAADADI